MKKIIITTFLSLCATLAYAGPNCGGCSGDKDKDVDKKSGMTQSSITIACDSSCDGDKKGKKGDKSTFSQDTMEFAGNCGGCSGDKKGGDKKGDDEKSGMTLSSEAFACDSSCDGDKKGKKGDKSTFSQDTHQFAGVNCGGCSGDKKGGDKKGDDEKSGITISSEAFACDSSCDGSKKGGDKKDGLSPELSEAIA